jgi:hypothetical protein
MLSSYAERHFPATIGKMSEAGGVVETPTVSARKPGVEKSTVDRDLKRSRRADEVVIEADLNVTILKERGIAPIAVRCASPGLSRKRLDPNVAGHRGAHTEDA